MRQGSFKVLLPAAAAMVMAPSFASALALSATGTYSINGGAPVTESQTSPPTVGPVDILPSAGDALGNSIFMHVYGDTSGQFGSRSSGTGFFDATGLYFQTETVTNTSGIAQNYVFDFVVDAGNLGINTGGATLGAAEGGSASYIIDVLLNGTSIANSQAQLSLTSAGSTFSESGTFSLGGAAPTSSATSTSYSWNPLAQSIDLGVFAAAESFTLAYSMKTIATGSFVTKATGSGCSVDGNVGGGDFFAAALNDEGGFIGGECSSLGNSTAQIGDPNQFSGNGATITAMSVPEPGTVLLMGAGLVGVGLSRRAKKA